MSVTELRSRRPSSSTRFEPAALPPRRPRVLPPVKIRPEDLADPFPDFAEPVADQRALAAARRAHPAGRGARPSHAAPLRRQHPTARIGENSARTFGRAAPAGPRVAGNDFRAAVGAAAAQRLPELAPRPLPPPERRPSLRVVEGTSPRERRRHRRMMSLAVLCTLGVALAFFAAVVLHANLAQGQVRLDNLQRSVTAAEKERTLLRATVAGLESPERIVAAGARLGLVAPNHVKFVSSGSTIYPAGSQPQ